MTLRPSDPAIQHYWFGKAYRDLVAVIVASWGYNIASARNYWTRARHADGEVLGWVQRIFFGFSSFAVIVFGTIVWLIAVPLHVAVVSSLGLVVCILFLLAGGAEAVYLWWRGWHAYCKACKEPMRIPVYICPGCGQRHHRLVPSRFGIFMRRCNCGRKIPCSFFSGRHKLEARCPNPNCDHPVLPEDVASSNTVIAFVGAPSAGKSAYLTAAALALIEDYAPSRGWAIQFTDIEDRERYERLLEDVRRFGGAVKTMDEHPPAYKFLINNVGGFEKRTQLFLCDLKGEVFHESDRVGAHRQFSNSIGTVFIVDPFSFPGVKRRYADKLARSGMLGAVAREDPARVLNQFVAALQNHHSLAVNAMWKRPIAFVVCKLDICNLGAEIGLPPVFSPAQVRRWLEVNAGDEFLNICGARFSNHEFFGVASIECSGSGARVNRYGVLPPLQWILEQAGSSLAESRRR